MTFIIAYFVIGLVLSLLMAYLLGKLDMTGEESYGILIGSVIAWPIALLFIIYAAIMGLGNKGRETNTMPEDIYDSHPDLDPGLENTKGESCRPKKPVKKSVKKRALGSKIV